MASNLTPFGGRGGCCVYDTFVYFFFFNATATTEIYTRPYTLSLHDALPIYTVAVQGIGGLGHLGVQFARKIGFRTDRKSTRRTPVTRSYLVCRLLLEKKKKKNTINNTTFIIITKKKKKKKNNEN